MFNKYSDKTLMNAKITKIKSKIWIWHYKKMKAKDNFRTTCLIESSYQYIKKDTRKNADYNHENSMNGY